MMADIKTIHLPYSSFSVFIKKKIRKMNMEATDIEKIEQIIRDRKHAHKYFTEHSQAYGAFVNLAKFAFAMDGCAS
jgi:hypothetical protein